MHLMPNELGAVQVVLERFQRQRLPRLLSLKKSVDQGEVLNDFDLSFLTTSIEDVKNSEHFAETHPEFRTLIAEVSTLYHHITEKALENEKVRLI